MIHDRPFKKKNIYIQTQPCAGAGARLGCIPASLVAARRDTSTAPSAWAWRGPEAERAQQRRAEERRRGGSSSSGSFIQRVTGAATYWEPVRAAVRLLESHGVRGCCARWKVDQNVLLLKFFNEVTEMNS